MRLIIDIPRKVNEHIRSGYGHGYFPQNKEDRNIIAKAIYDSTPIPDNATVCDIEQYAKEHNLFICTTNIIEQIREDIEQFVGVSIHDVEVIAKNDVLQIIDKYAEQEPCEDVVSRQAVYEILDGNWNTDFLRAEVEKLPSVRPQEQTGHWKRISMDRYTTHAQYWYECDKCGEHNLGNTDFCPSCGARMESEERNEHPQR